MGTQVEETCLLCSIGTQVEETCLLCSMGTQVEETRLLCSMGTFSAAVGCLVASVFLFVLFLHASDSEEIN